eukprot:TRINITY_DN101912_c0_g1_i1.p1 TRINITY_DN101912_c0_g1~~TRINITY_DN101912_c0_g1_i1.p1  ORF type:complete len:840 (-),score=98.06 TRINITY_DN101912_c0_g1_i1:3-2522(-)
MADEEEREPDGEMIKTFSGHTAMSRTTSHKSSYSVDGIAPAYKGAADFYLKDRQAIQNSKYDELSAMYPMLCYCDILGSQPPCRFTSDGHRGRIPLRRKLLYSGPAFGWQALWWHKSAYQKKFYIDDFPQANLGMLTMFVVLSVIVDAFTDPKMAGLTDSWKSKYGRRRPFIFLSAFVVPLVFVLGWSPLQLKGTAASIWYGIFHIAVKLGDTLFTITHSAWGAQLTPLAKERTSCWMWKDLYANFGILFGIAVFPLVLHDMLTPGQCTSTPDTPCVQQPLIAATIGTIFMIECLLLVFWGREPTYEQIQLVGKSDSNAGLLAAAATDAGRSTSQTAQYSEEDTIPVLLACCLNKIFRIVLLSVFAKGAGAGVPFLLLPFVTPWVVGQKCFDGSFATLLGATVMIFGLLAVVPWTWMAGALGKLRAYYLYNAAVLTTSLLFIFIAPDSGDCVSSYYTIGVCCIWGASYGGSFLQSDVICDSIDYDELLTGGRRREGAYMMAMEFIPKFVTIPGECIPLLLMAAFKYHRPTPEDFRPACGPELGLGDAFCAAHYSNETQGSHWCHATKSCADLVADGITFVCSDALSQCSISQNDKVVWLLRICFSIVPAFFIGTGLLALSFYPKEAKGEAQHEKLLYALTLVKRGQTVEDPWRPGSFVKPAVEPGPNFGALSYMWPSELRAVLKSNMDFTWLLKRNLYKFTACVLLVPLGVIVMVAGWEDLGDEMGASLTPIGLMIIGAAILGMWWCGTRAMVARALNRAQVPREEVIKYCDAMGAFEGINGCSKAKPDQQRQQQQPDATKIGHGEPPTETVPASKTLELDPAAISVETKQLNDEVVTI